MTYRFLKCALADLEMFLEVGNAHFPKSLIDSSNFQNNDIQNDFCTEKLSLSPKSMIRSNFYEKTPFFNIFVTLYIDESHDQTVNRHSSFSLHFSTADIRSILV